MNNDELLQKASEWLFNLRKLADTSALIANALLDTQPEGLSLSSLRTFKADPLLLVKLEKDLVHQAKVIGAIKEYRARTGLGLKESIEAIDKYRDTLPRGTPGAPGYVPSLDPHNPFDR